jgi:hypothetical protein
VLRLKRVGAIEAPPDRSALLLRLDSDQPAVAPRWVTASAANDGSIAAQLIEVLGDPPERRRAPRPQRDDAG